MERINRNNYERFLIEFLEGELDAQQELELNAFLANHPDLKEEFELVRTVTPMALPPSIDSPNFGSLKKEETIKISDDEIIAALEGDLDEMQQQEFNRKLATYPNLKSEYELFKLTKLLPTVLAFEGKSMLKRQSARIRPLFRNAVAIAATVLLLGIGGGLLLLIKQKKNPEIATVVNPISVTDDKVTNRHPLQTNRETLEQKKGNGKTRLSLKQELKVVTNSGTLEMVRIDPKINFPELGVEPKMDFALDIKTGTGISKPSKEIEVQSPVYITPKEWLVAQLKNLTPEFIKTVTDSISQEKPAVESTANLALGMVEKATGIRYSTNPNEGGGFSLVSKYFAYERITHP